MAEVKIEIKSIFGKVLFEYAKEDNTIRDTLIEAVKRGAYLRGANLVGADLGGANLVGAGKLSKPDDILIVGNIGSRFGYTTIYNTDNGIKVQCGCFFGNMDEFAKKVEETHKGTRHERDYKALIEFAKVKFSKYEQ